MFRIPLLLALLAALLLPVAAAADENAPSPDPATPPAPTAPAVQVAKKKRKRKTLPLGTRAARYARRFVGVRYTYGGLSPRTGFDCSGLVTFVYRHFGVQLPHYSAAQFGYGRAVSRAGLRPGDLVFFNGLGHVGIYIGAGRFVEAPHTGARVRVSTLGWYGGSYDGARRIFAAA
jgi:cell wall-associated NlpC family hydrolase